MNKDTLLRNYRPNVGVVLFNAKGDVFYGHRIELSSSVAAEKNRTSEWRWQMPQGGVDKGERYIDAAYRELKEETGVTSARLLTMTPGWLTYDFPNGYSRKGWRGQRQKWAAMLFEGDDGEVDLCTDDSQEFDDWRWGALEDAPSLIVPFKKSVYLELVDCLTPLRNFIVAMKL